MSRIERELLQIDATRAQLEAAVQEARAWRAQASPSVARTPNPA